MKLTNDTSIFIICLLMVGCGGGSDDSSTPDPAVAVVEEPVVAVVEPPVVTNIVEPDPNAIYDSTAELIVSRKFLLKPEYALTVSYKNDGDRNAYLSICTDFTDGEEGIKVNYNSCLLRTSIESDYAGTLTVANDKNRLVMAIWYFDDMKNPRYEIWENDLNAKGVRTFDVN